MGAWVAQRFDHVEELDDRSGPAVREDQGQGIGLGRTGVYEMHVLAVDRRRVLIERVQAGLLRPPVVLIGPVVDQLAQVGHVGTEVPPGAGNLIGEAGIVQSLTEIGQLGVGDCDTERSEGLSGSRRGGAIVHGGRVIGRRIRRLVRCPR